MSYTNSSLEKARSEMPYSDLSPDQERQVFEMADRYEARMHIAIWDWAVYKKGVEYGLFDTAQRSQVEKFFRQWPKAWALVRPHFQAPERLHILKAADRFSDRIEKYFGITGQDSFRYLLSLEPYESPSIRGLGVAPLLIIAGIALLSVLGITGVLWAIGYWKEQDNVTLLIDGVTRGNIDPAVLSDAINNEQQSIFGEVAESFTSFALLAIVGGGLWLFSNILSSAGVFRKARA
jgi:hypothetical protein